jgi:hypothetical protein
LVIGSLGFGYSAESRLVPKVGGREMTNDQFPMTKQLRWILVIGSLGFGYSAESRLVLKVGVEPTPGVSRTGF